MPLGKGVRYRWKNGVRLAFKGNQVIEVKKKGGVAHRVGKRAHEKHEKRMHS